MTWAFFSDVHGNQEALTAVVADFARQGVTRSFFLGDAVGYGASPKECLKMVSDLTDVRLLGNHDEAVLRSSPPEDFNEYAKVAVLWTRSVLNGDSRARIESFTMEHCLEDFHLAHASPHMPGRWDYIVDPLAAELAFESFDESVCLIGHTHQPLVFKKMDSKPCTEIATAELVLDTNERYLINVGSVGQPRDGDPRACYVLYDPETRRMSYRRVVYDVAAAQQKIRRTNLPGFLAVRLEMGR